MSYIKIKHNTERSFITLNTTFAEHYKLIVEIEPVFDSEINNKMCFRATVFLQADNSSDIISAYPKQGFLQIGNIKHQYSTCITVYSGQTKKLFHKIFSIEFNNDIQDIYIACSLDVKVSLPAGKLICHQPDVFLGGNIRFVNPKNKYC